jgi:hypothetical protein
MRFIAGLGLGGVTCFRNEDMAVDAGMTGQHLIAFGGGPYYVDKSVSRKSADSQCAESA